MENEIYMDEPHILINKQEHIKKSKEKSFRFSKISNHFTNLSSKNQLLLILITLVTILTVVINYLVSSEKYKSQNEKASTQTQISDNENADWEVYTNYEKNFTFKYPPNFGVSEYTTPPVENDEPTVIQLYHKQARELNYPSITLYVIETDRDIKQWINDKKYCSDSSMDCINPTEGPIQHSIQFESKNRHFENINTFFKLNGFLIRFNLGTKVSRPIRQNERDTFNQILSTFQFINPSEASAE